MNRLLTDKELQDQFCKSCKIVERSNCAFICQHSLKLIKDNLLSIQDNKTAVDIVKEINPFIGLLISCIMCGEKLPDAYERWYEIRNRLMNE